MTHIKTRIEAQIPRLLRYAVALTHNRPEAEELVQDCLARALSRTHLWENGTDLRAWLFTILHNQYVNRVHRAARQRTVKLYEDDPMLAGAATQGGASSCAICTISTRPKLVEIAPRLVKFG